MVLKGIGWEDVDVTYPQGQMSVVSSSEHNNECSASIKGGEFPEQLHEYQLYKKDCFMKLDQLFIRLGSQPDVITLACIGIHQQNILKCFKINLKQQCRLSAVNSVSSQIKQDTDLKLLWVSVCNKRKALCFLYSLKLLFNIWR